METNQELIALGARIKQLRQQKKMTQAELAQAADIHVTYLSTLENGTRNPSYMTLLAIAKGLNVKVSQLVNL